MEYSIRTQLMGLLRKSLPRQGGAISLDELALWHREVREISDEIVADFLTTAILEASKRVSSESYDEKKEFVKAVNSVLESSNWAIADAENNSHPSFLVAVHSRPDDPGRIYLHHFRPYTKRLGGVVDLPLQPFVLVSRPTSPQVAQGKSLDN